MFPVTPILPAALDEGLLATPNSFVIPTPHPSDVRPHGAISIPIIHNSFPVAFLLNAFLTAIF
jgi:hypothetical protein